MMARLGTAWLLAAALALVGGHAAAQDTDFAGVYAVRRVVTSSTCANSAVGDVSSSSWMVEWTAAAGFTMNALGATSFRTFSGTMSGETLTLTSQGEGSAAGNTMTVTLERGRRGAVSGTETVAVVSGGSGCSVVRSVAAHSLH